MASYSIVPTSTQSLITSPWYKAHEEEAHPQLFALVRHLRKQSGDRRAQWWRHFGLFDRMGLMGTRYFRKRTTENRLAVNVIRSAVLAVHAKIVQNKPRPMYLTIGGDYGDQQRAKKTQSYSDGCIYHANAYGVAADAALHAIALGTAHAYCGRGPDGKPIVENVFGPEIDVERVDSAGRRPGRIYRTRAVPRSALLREYEGDEGALSIIRNASPSTDDFYVEDDDLADYVTVCRAHMAGTKDCPGRHVLALETGCLVDEPWPRELPYSHLRWGDRLRGFFGYGVAEQLTDLQYEINALLLRIQEQMAMAGPKVAVARGSQVSSDDINNEIWGILEYTGQPPVFMQVQSVDPALIQQVRELKQDAFDEVGISQLAVRSEKPPGLNSGKALDTWSDLESARFIAFGQAYEQLLIDISRQFIGFAHSAANDDETVKQITVPVKRHRKRFLEKVALSDIVRPDEETICQVFPTSALAQTPSVKLQQIQDLANQGIIPASAAAKLMDFPDLEAETSLMHAPIDYIDDCIDQILEHGQKMHVEPWLQLDLAIPRLGYAANRARVENAPEDRVQALGAFLAECVKKQKEQQAASAPPQAAAPPALPPPAAMGG